MAEELLGVESLGHESHQFLCIEFGEGGLGSETAEVAVVEHGQFLVGAQEGGGAVRVYSEGNAGR